MTREDTLVELKTVEVGYGYTVDGGETWPLRGKGVGTMASLTDVLTIFPTRTLVNDAKSNDPSEGALLAESPHSHRSTLARLRAIGGRSQSSSAHPLRLLAKVEVVTLVPYDCILCRGQVLSTTNSDKCSQWEHLSLFELLCAYKIRRVANNE